METQQIGYCCRLALLKMECAGLSHQNLFGRTQGVPDPFDGYARSERPVRVVTLPGELVGDEQAAEAPVPEPAHVRRRSAPNG